MCDWEWRPQLELQLDPKSGGCNFDLSLEPAICVHEMVGRRNNKSTLYVHTHHKCFVHRWLGSGATKNHWQIQQNMNPTWSRAPRTDSYFVGFPDVFDITVAWGSCSGRILFWVFQNMHNFILFCNHRVVKDRLVFERIYDAGLMHCKVFGR